MKKDPALDGWKPRALSGFVELVGPLWTRKEDEAWAYGLLAEAKHANAVGIVHGGVLTTLLDHALSAVAWEANERKPCVTVTLDVHFLEAVRPGDLIVARGRVVRKTASLAFMQGNLAVDAREIATGSAVLRIK